MCLLIRSNHKKSRILLNCRLGALESQIEKSSLERNTEEKRVLEGESLKASYHWNGEEIKKRRRIYRIKVYPRRRWVLRIFRRDDWCAFRLFDCKEFQKVWLLYREAKYILHINRNLKNVKEQLRAWNSRALKLFIRKIWIPISICV